MVSDSLQPHGPQHARLPCPLPTPGAYSNSCPSCWRCHPTISSSVTHFFSCLQSYPASGPFPLSQFFVSGGQSIGVPASVSERQHQFFQWIWHHGQRYVNIVGSPHWWNVILQPSCIRCYTCPGEKIGRKQNSGSFEVELDDCSDVEYWILQEGNEKE